MGDARMRALVTVLALCVLAWGILAAPGCSKSEDQPKSTGVLEAPGAYIEATAGAKVPAEIKLKKANLEQFIKQFQAMNERFPASLDEIKKNGALADPPSGYHWTYDAKTGAVDIVKN
jgi:hypothetical protein